MSYYSDLILKAGPAVYLRLGESSGTVARDVSGNKLDGTYSGTFSLSQAGTIIGDTDKAVHLDGASGFILSSYNPFTNGTVRSFAGWMLRDDTTTSGGLFGAAANFANRCWFPSGTNDVRFQPGGGTQVVWTGAAPAAGSYFHLALVFDEPNDLATLYINGTPISTQAATSTWLADSMRVGANFTNFFKGSVDEFVVFERGLTADEILAHYQAGAGGPAIIVAPQAPRLRVVSFGTGGVSYELTDKLEGLRYSNVRYGGDETASFTYAKCWKTSLPEIAKGNVLRIQSGLDVLWQGRIQELDPGGAESEEVGVTAFGSGARLKDATFREIYIDSDLNNWQGESTQFKINLIAAGFGTDEGSVTPDATTGAPSLETGVDGPWAAGGLAASEAFYDAKGIALGSLFFAWKKAASVDNTDVNWNWAADLSLDDIETAADSSANLRAAGPGSGTVTAAAANRFFARVAMTYAIAAGTANKRYSIFWTTLASYGRHGLTKGVLTPAGFTADKMIADIVGRASGITARRIDAQTLEIQQMVFSEPTYHEDGVAKINELQGCEWGTWGPSNVFDLTTNGYFDFANPDTTTKHWVAFRRDLDAIGLQVNLTALYNQVNVVWQDTGGTTYVTTRTTSVPELDSRGITRTATLQGGTMTLLAAQALGDTFLALQGAYAPSSGSLSVSQPVRHYRRGMLPPHYLRADGSNFAVPDVLPSSQLFALSAAPDRRTTFPISRVDVDASGSKISVSVSLDQTRDLLSILQARLAAGGTGGGPIAAADPQVFPVGDTF